MLIFDFPTCADAIFESDELVRLWGDGKFSILLWMIGDGPRRPDISGVPSLLGLDGRLAVGNDAGNWSARWANSGGACGRGSLVEVESGSGIEGLCGRVVSRLGDCLSLTLVPSMITVDAADDEVEDSLTVESV
jgi:hypothetical protein